MAKQIKLAIKIVQNLTTKSGTFACLYLSTFDVPIIEAQKKVENKDPFEEKLAYGIVLDDSITIND
jgi:hypothetical protein